MIGVQEKEEGRGIEIEEGWISRFIPSDEAQGEMVHDIRKDGDSKQEIDGGEGWIGRSIPSVLIGRRHEDMLGTELGVKMDIDEYGL